LNLEERPRLLEGPLARALRQFPVVALVGLRQVGKTMLVRRAGRGRAFVTLDDLGALEAARRDPAGFVASRPRPTLR
jgi:predicted AAA+ superfamily ATPase